VGLGLALAARKRKAGAPNTTWDGSGHGFGTFRM
jgi:hypothetical protein